MNDPRNPRTLEDRLGTVRESAAYWAEKQWSGCLGAAERRDMNAWIEEHPLHELEFDLALELLESQDLTLALQGEANAGRLVSAHPSSGRFRARSRSTGRKGFMHMLAGGATAIAAALALGVFLDVDVMSWLPGYSGSSGAGIEYATLDGELLNTTLADGTVLELNGGTEVVVEFTEATRNVRLINGDAYFSVASDASRPFRVITPHATATALGTAFSVSLLTEATVVSVLESRVEVSRPDKTSARLVAEPGARVEARPGEAFSVTSFDVGDAADWRAGWIEAPSLTLQDLGLIMERRSGRRIVVDEASAELEVFGRFNITDPATVLNALSLAYGLEVRESDDVIHIAKSPE